MANSFGNLGAVIVALAEIGAIIADRSQQEEQGLTIAARLCGSTAPHIGTPGLFIWINTRQLYDEAIARAKSMISAQLWNQGYSLGRGMSLDEAIGLASQVLKHGE